MASTKESVRRRQASRDPLQAGPRSSRPILAINEGGSVTRANAPARRALEPILPALEGADLGAVLVDLICGHRDRRRPASFSFTGTTGELEEIFVVLSDTAGGEEVSGETAVAPPKADAASTQIKFLDFIAHELRNPLGTILGLAEILERRTAKLSPEDQRLAYETIRVDAERALLILDSILRLAEARANAGVKLSSVPLHAVGRRVIEAHRRRYPHRVIFLTGDSPLYARANSMWVELALSNLIGNAEKYTPADRAIEVAFHQNGSRATILVMDNGAGLASDSYRLVWDVYRRGTSPDMTVKGSGIGLALCKELIEGMNGEVWAGPRHASGSVFAVTLPSPWDTEIPESLGTPISGARQVREQVAVWV